MRSMGIKQFALGIIDKLPIGLQHIIYKTVIETGLLVFRIKWVLRNPDTPDPSRIYWVSPERIKYHTNYLPNKKTETVPFRDRAIRPPTLRGKVLDGDWDISDYEFTDLDVYQSFKKRFDDGAKWQDTDFYKRVLGQVESGDFVWDLKNKDDLDNRFKFLDSLYESIKNNGYRLSRTNYDKNISFDEIDVNIGRNGDYLFQNGVHRLSIAKILGVKYVPVMVFVRHKEWQAFRKYVFSYAQEGGGKLYQPIVHPDLADIPYDQYAHNYQDLMAAIEHHLGKKTGVMLDLGANQGFFCHKFEDLGYRCYAVENDPVVFRILQKVKIAENKKFRAINKSIFDVEFIKKMEFDVVLALNVFHHFLKTKRDFLQLIYLLKNLKTSEMYFEPHIYEEDQMKGAYTNLNETEFIDFILQYTALTTSEIIYTAKSGRHVFKLSK